MKSYLELVNRILEEGKVRGDRTGTGTISKFGETIRFDLQDGFPLLTTKKMGIKSILAELLWFLEGSTDNNRLNELGSTIWDEWALEDGSLGPIYGKQWVAWDDYKVISPNERELYEDMDYVKISGLDNGDLLMYRRINQIANVIESLKFNPMSRRHIVSAWNPADLPSEYKWVSQASDDHIEEIVKRYLTPHDNVRRGKAALAFCHDFFQFYVENLDTPIDGKTQKLHCRFDVRSNDIPLGFPYNVASYAALTMMIAQCVDMVPGDLIYQGGDVHIYLNQLETIKTQLVRDPLPLPKLKINPNVKDIFSFTMDDFNLEGYQSHPAIKFDVSV